MRLVQCITCRTLQVIPDWRGRPEDDPYLTDIILQHGGPEGGHRANLHRIEEEKWRLPAVKRQVVKEMWSGFTGFTPEYYDVKDTFKEDALKCWNDHRRPGRKTHLCSDYRNPNRRLGNPAFRDRAKLAQELHNDDIKFQGPTVYLCQFCPYNVEVQAMKADKYGDFSDKLV